MVQFQIIPLLINVHKQLNIIRYLYFFVERYNLLISKPKPRILNNQFYSYNSNNIVVDWSKVNLCI